MRRGQAITPAPRPVKTINASVLGSGTTLKTNKACGNGASPKSEVTWIEARGLAVVVRKVYVPIDALAAIAKVISVTWRGTPGGGGCIEVVAVAPRSPDCPFAVVVVIKPGSAPDVELNENGNVPILFPSGNVKYVTDVIVSDGAIAFDTINQYDRP